MIINDQIQIDELIDTNNYTKDTREYIISDSAYHDILKNTYSGLDYKYLSDAFKLLRLNKICEFKRLVSSHKTIINIKYQKTYLIHEACKLGYVDCVAVLLFLGARCSILDDNGYMAQHYVIKYEKLIQKAIMIIDLLCLFGNNMNVKDSRGNTPFYYAVESEKIDIIQRLIVYKVNPFIKDVNELLNIYKKKNKQIYKLLDTYIKTF